jgi:pilus assembly protein CpaF
MLSLTITEKGGSPQPKQFAGAEVTIGRVQGNDIVLPKSNISKRHARLIQSGADWRVEDAGSTNGTFVNGRKLTEGHTLRAGDKVFVGDFQIEVRLTVTDPAAARPTRQPLKDRMGKTEELSDVDLSSLPMPRSGSHSGRTQDPAPAPPAQIEDEWDHGAIEDDDGEAAASPEPKDEQGQNAHHQDDQPQALPEEQSGLVQIVHERLLARLGPQRTDAKGSIDRESQVQGAVEDIVNTMQRKGELPKGIAPDILIDCVLHEAVGLGPLQELLDDVTVTEILVNNARQIYVERKGKLEMCDMVFSSDDAVMQIIERIVAPLGRRISAKQPMVDARLKDGSRVNAIVPPLAVKGPTLTIRKFTREPLQVDDLVAGGSLNADMAEFLETCVKARKNIVVSGGTGSGKTTLLNVLSTFIGSQERILTIEDAAELKLEQTHVVSLESRPGVVGEEEAIGIRALVRNALRMRPDRIIVGECRGDEAIDMLQAMNTGHDGSMTTVHANGPRDALTRLETMIMLSGVDIPPKAIREQVAGAVNVIVHQARFPDGSRRITHISEITGMEGDIISMHDLFHYEQQGMGADHRIQGRFRATGVIPKFYDSLRARGLSANLGIFRGA